MIGVLNVFKPKGITSSNIVVKIKKILNIKKVGHMGTLDPLASGVLPICIGNATRLFDYFLKKQKTYIAQFSFGFETETLDLEGKVVKVCDKKLKEQDIKKALICFLGKSFQEPPLFSSKKINGKKAYDLARQNVNVELKKCEIEIFDYKFLKQVNENTFEFLIKCSAGTYIRALARDLAKKLNTVATMTSLIRIKSGQFCIEDSVDINEISKENLLKNLLPLDNVLKDFNLISVSEEDYKKLISGLSINAKDYLKLNFKDNDSLVAIKLNNEIFAIGEINKDFQVKMKTFFGLQNVKDNIKD